MISRTVFTKFLLVIIISVSTITLFGCGSQQSALLGKWERVSTNITAFVIVPDKVEFLQDGTFVLAGFASGKYSFPEGNRIKFDFGNGTFVYKYTLSGDTLILDMDGQTAEYKRVK